MLFGLALLSGGVLTAHAVGGCNDSALIMPPTCAPGACSCEEDPAQSSCAGFNDRSEGGPATADPADASGGDARVDSSVDAEVDASDDGASAAD